MVGHEIATEYGSPEEREAAFDDARSILEAPVDIPPFFQKDHPWRDMPRAGVLHVHASLDAIFENGNMAASGLPETGKRIEKGRPDKLRELAKLSASHDRFGFIASVQLWTGLGELYGSFAELPDTPEARHAWYARAAQSINHIPYLSAGQLFELANMGPAGYYRSGGGVGRISAEGELTSAFSTLNEGIPEYPRAYALSVAQAHEQLASVRPFTEEDPFMVFVFGDGEGRIGQAIQPFAEGGFLGDYVHIVMADLSGELVQDQGKAIGNDEVFRHIRWDARQVGALLARLGKPVRGVIIAGEELIDVFSPVVIGKHKGQLMELGFDLGNPEAIRSMGMPLDVTPYGPFIKKVIELFPRYRDMIMNGDVPPDQGVPINIGFLQMLRGIADSKFQGYWMMGDYYGGAFGSFRRPEAYMKMLRMNPPVRGFTQVSPSDAVPIRTAFDLTCDLTGDVDPAFLQVGYALGMRKELLAKPFQFIDAAYGKPSFTIPQMELWVRQIRQRIGAGLTPEQTEYIMALMGRISDLTEGRMNFVGSFGDPDLVPPLFGRPPKEW